MFRADKIIQVYQYKMVMQKFNKKKWLIFKDFLKQTIWNLKKNKCTSAVN